MAINEDTKGQRTRKAAHITASLLTGNVQIKTTV